MHSLLSSAHTIYHKTIPQGSDFLSLFTTHIGNDTYMGTPVTKLYDFSLGALKTLTMEEGMPHMTDCIDAMDMIHIDNRLGFSEFLFEHSWQGKMDGLYHMSEARFIDIPNAVQTCFWAVQSDAPQLV
jgi:hypothetical protein